MNEIPVLVDGAIVWGGGVRPVIDRFVLIRREKEFCAIKFTGAWRGNDVTKPTMFNSGEESFRSEYDLYYTPNYLDEWNVSAAHSRRGEVRRAALKGIGRFSFQTVNSIIECGSMRFNWFPPTAIALFGGALKEQKQGDYGYEMALTKWRALSDIRPDAPYLKWYRYDESRPEQVINVDELW